MLPSVTARPRVRGRLRRHGVLAIVTLGLFVAASLSVARPVPRNLGGGLERLASGDAAPIGASARRSLAPGQVATSGVGEGTAPVLAERNVITRDADGRVLVKITLDGQKPLKALTDRLASIPGARVTAVDAAYRAGVIEAYVPAEQLVPLATTEGVLAIVPASPVAFDVGMATTQGIIQHRLDRLGAGANGAGITVGVLSDSYNTSDATIKAADDVASGDLPGAGNPLGNLTPVEVLQDFPDGTDEGRGMLQIVHDVAPRARLGFATANGGELTFANNIRSLAGLASGTNTRDGFKADVVVDDVIYLAEPMFQDGVVARAVDDVVAAGVSYFSSAGNRPATQGYDAPLRPVPAVESSIAGTNLDFSTVDPALYAGGFHNFAGAEGVDIAQTVAITGNGTLVLQWNEPFDPVPPTVIETLAVGTGTITEEEPFVVVPFAAEAGQTIRILADGDDSAGNPNPDVMIYLFNAAFEVIGFRDATTNPEVLYAEIDATGDYYAVIEGYDGATGDVYCQVDSVEIEERVLTDLNVLFFTSGGAFVGALSEENRITNRPIELGGFSNLPGTITLQIVIARANEPEAQSRKLRPADRLRYVWFGNGVPQEYFSYMASVTYGHNCARGANSVAAYPFYPPYIPESFTSPGYATIYFDRDNRRHRFPEIRLKPDLAAMDGANTTFFGDEVPQDPDTLPNFFGTSASAPHAAGIAALMLQAAGGPGSLRPDKVSDILKQSTFPHDLDPHFAFGVARTRRGGHVGVSAAADPNSISQFDPNVFTVANFGLGRLARVSFDLSGGNTTGAVPGLVFDERPTVGQAFILGALDGVDAAQVSPALEIPADPPGLAGQWKKLTLSFAAGSFGWGDSIGFGIDRDEADAFGPSGAVAGNSADLLGAGVLIPQGVIAPGGAAFSGALENGESFGGRFQNLIGDGYSRLDGFGFINAEEAVRLAGKRRPGRR